MDQAGAVSGALRKATVKRRSLVLSQANAMQSAMRQFQALLILCAVTLSLFATTMTHARESVTCIDARAAVEAGHVDGDTDQVPADGDKDVPHHHSACHGHQVAPGTAANATLLTRLANALPVPAQAYALPKATTDPALRPPQA